jgi:hypothetical protein
MYKIGKSLVSSKLYNANNCHSKNFNTESVSQEVRFQILFKISSRDEE